MHSLFWVCFPLAKVCVQKSQISGSYPNLKIMFLCNSRLEIFDQKVSIQEQHWALWLRCHVRGTHSISVLPFKSQLFHLSTSLLLTCVLGGKTWWLQNVSRCLANPDAILGLISVGDWIYEWKIAPSLPSFLVSFLLFFLSFHISLSPLTFSLETLDILHLFAYL